MNVLYTGLWYPRILVICLCCVNHWYLANIWNIAFVLTFQLLCVFVLVSVSGLVCVSVWVCVCLSLCSYVCVCRLSVCLSSVSLCVYVPVYIHLRSIWIWRNFGHLKVISVLKLQFTILLVAVFSGPPLSML